MSENGDTTKVIRKVSRWGKLAVTFLVFPFCWLIGGVGVFNIVHRTIHPAEPVNLPVWVPVGMMVVGLIPFAVLFRAEFFAFAQPAAELASKLKPSISFGRKKEDE